MRYELTEAASSASLGVAFWDEELRRIGACAPPRHPLPARISTKREARMRLLDSLYAAPRRMFVLDGLGAAVSAVALGLVLPRFSELVGAAPSALRFLAVIPVGIAAFDLACALARPTAWRAALRLVACANLVYPWISAAALWRDELRLLPLGHVYFGVEFAVVAALGAFQLHLARVGQD